MDDYCARERVRRTVIRMDTEGEAAASAGGKAVLPRIPPGVEIHPFLILINSVRGLLELLAASGLQP